MKYGLDIYLPGAGREVLYSLDSTSPFMAFAEGDIINTSGLSPNAISALKSIREEFPEKYPHGIALRVMCVEHMIREGKSDITHKVCLFTGLMTSQHRELVDGRNGVRGLRFDQVKRKASPSLYTCSVAKGTRCKSYEPSHRGACALSPLTQGFTWICVSWSGSSPSLVVSATADAVGTATKARRFCKSASVNGASLVNCNSWTASDKPTKKHCGLRSVTKSAG